MLIPDYSPTTWGVARIGRKGGGQVGGGGGDFWVRTKRCKCNCGEFGYQISMLYVTTRCVSEMGCSGQSHKNGDTPLDHGTSFWLCMIFDSVNPKEYLPIFLTHYKISVKSTGHGSFLLGLTPVQQQVWSDCHIQDSGQLS